MLPFAVKNIDHVVFRVRDLERAVKFYESALGCTVVKRREDLGLVHLRAGSSMIDLISVLGKLGSTGGAAPGVQGRNADHLCLRIEPFEEAAIREHLLKHGRSDLGPVVSNFGAEGTGPSLYLTDPDGNTIELKGAARPQEGDAYPLAQPPTHYGRRRKPAMRHWCIIASRAYATCLRGRG